MELSYHFQGILPLAQYVSQLSEVAAKRGLVVVPQEENERGADFHFFAPNISWKGLTGIKIACGEGWDDELVKSQGMKAWPRNPEMSVEVAEMLVNWALERKQLRQIRPLRHEMGNLVVIFLARISKLKGVADDENIDKLENLHQRLDELYRRFERITIF